MYKLVITSGSGPSRKVESKEYWMTQAALHKAEADFEKLQRQPNVVKLMLWRVDVKGVHDLRKWVREYHDRSRRNETVNTQKHITTNA